MDSKISLEDFIKRNKLDSIESNYLQITHNNVLLFTYTKNKDQLLSLISNKIIRDDKCTGK